MFMEATSSHGFERIKAQSRRGTTYTKLAEVTVSADWFARPYLHRQAGLGWNAWLSPLSTHIL